MNIPLTHKNWDTPTLVEVIFENLEKKERKVFDQYKKQ